MTAPLPPLGIVRLLTDTLRLSAAGFGRLLPYALVPALISAVLIGVTDSGDPAQVTAGDLWAGAIDLVLGTFVTGVLCLAALDVRLGRRHGIGDYLRQAARHLLPLLVFGLALSVAMALGLVFFVLPGLYVAGRYLPYVPTTVFEDRGWQGTNRAEELTQGYRWPLVGLLLLFAVLLILFYMVVGLPLAIAAAHLGLVPAILANALLTAIGYTVFATFTTEVYLRLRLLRDGAGPAAVAAEVG